jgi:hypothetical protein
MSKWGERLRQKNTEIPNRHAAKIAETPISSVLAALPLGIPAKNEPQMLPERLLYTTPDSISNDAESKSVTERSPRAGELAFEESSRCQNSQKGGFGSIGSVTFRDFRKNKAQSEPLPSYGDLDERAAIIADSEDISQDEATRRAVAELLPGVPFADALLSVWRQEIGIPPRFLRSSAFASELEEAAARDMWKLQKLAVWAFDDSLIARAIELGWDAVALFGIHPLAPRERGASQGLIPAWAWTGLSITGVDEITEDVAFYITAHGSRLRQTRTKPAETGAVPFWEIEDHV